MRKKALTVFISLVCGVSSAAVLADENIIFNTEVLDIDDRKNFDLSQFSRGGYILPGVYEMSVHVNKVELPQQSIIFYSSADVDKKSRACIDETLFRKLGFRPEILRKAGWWHEGECFDESKLAGVEIRGELSTSTLYISIPQAYLEYSDANWDPPSRWDEGIPGLIVDYNFNGQSKYSQGGGETYSLNGNGTVGANLGAWRARADWQSSMQHASGQNERSGSQYDWTRYYAYRALPQMGAKLTVGETYLDSSLFDSLRFSGMSLATDDNMLSPNLRGYAPEVVGVAKTNARVAISQMGRVLYETTVAAGPFRIQDINDAITGELNVRVEEQDGSVQEFTLNTANIPYLTRPGSVRYRLAAGQPTDWQHHSYGPVFGTGEFSWGINNGWSLYGGAMYGDDYRLASLGVGRDLLVLGALSFDASQSQATLPLQGGQETFRGNSYRLSYSKRFEEYDSQITFAGYRFSERDYMSMNDFLDARYYGHYSGSGKEMYTITVNKNFTEIGLSSYLNYSHETYWDRSANDHYNLTLSHHADIGRLKNVSISLSAYRNEYYGHSDDGAYLSLSLPWGNSATLGLNTLKSKNDFSNQVSYYDRLDDHSSYKVSAGNSRHSSSLSAYYNHEGSMATVNSNLSYQSDSYTALGLSAQGGMTLTAEGGALHRGGRGDSPRMLIDTSGVADIPVAGYGRTTYSNGWGKAVIGNMSSYYRNRASIDLNKLSDNAQASQSVIEMTMTEGAIGYRKFDVISGMKGMAVITLNNGSTPPFGATVLNSKKQEVGIMDDAGSVYLSGINPGETMTVNWDGVPQCGLSIPADISTHRLVSGVSLPCRRL